MVLETIYLTRHGFRSNWLVNPTSGAYTSTIPSPTGIPSDPALAAHGVTQSHELAAHILTLSPLPTLLYSSPYYRCLQTLAPTVSALRPTSPHLVIRPENGLGEWYGLARFDHPSPAAPALLARLFPSLLDEAYVPKIYPPDTGESIAALHARVAHTMAEVIREVEEREPDVKCLMLCTHAATLLAVGRCLTGRVPAEWGEEDFGTWTCGLSRFERIGKKEGMEEGKGGWECVVNGDTGFLTAGRERGWWFQGDESFDTSVVRKDEETADQGVVVGVVETEKVEGKGPGAGAGVGSHL